MADRIQLPLPTLVKRIILPILYVSIHHRPVSIRHHRCIIRTLHASLNFKGGNPRLQKLWDMRDHTKVLRAHNEGALLRLFDRKRCVGALSSRIV